MDEAIRAKILKLLGEHRLLTIAANRPDGWPQAMTVGYANDGLIIYFLCGPESQKHRRSRETIGSRLTIDHDVADPMAITGLSMAAIAAIAKSVRDPAEILKATDLLMDRYPEYAAYPAPNSDQIRIMKVLPKVISILDYSKGFAHAESNYRVEGQFRPGTRRRGFCVAGDMQIPDRLGQHEQFPAAQLEGSAGDEQGVETTLCRARQEPEEERRRPVLGSYANAVVTFGAAGPAFRRCELRWMPNSGAL